MGSCCSLDITKDMFPAKEDDNNMDEGGRLYQIRMDKLLTYVNLGELTKGIIEDSALLFVDRQGEESKDFWSLFNSGF
jgi:hypothetical protein